MENNIKQSFIPDSLKPRDTLDWDLIRNALLIGGGLGTAGGLGVSYLNRMRHLQRQIERQKPEGIIEIARRGKTGEKDHSEKTAFTISHGLAGSGLALSGAGSYVLARRLAQAYKAQEEEQRLQQAHQHYLQLKERQRDETDKQRKQRRTKRSSEKDAQRQTEGLTPGLSTSMAFGSIPFLLALAGMVGTERYLSAKYPGVKSPAKDERKFRLQAPKQRRPRLTTVEDEESPKEDEEEAKKSSSADELIIHTILGDAERARAGQWDVVVKAAVNGYTDELIQAFKQDGVDGFFDKAAHLVHESERRLKDPTPDSRALAAYWLVKDSMIAPTVMTLASAEYRDMIPNFAKIASGLPEEVKDALVDVGEGFTDYQRHQVLSETWDTWEPVLKSASTKAAFNIGTVVRRALRHAGLSGEDSSMPESIDRFQEEQPPLDPYQETDVTKKTPTDVSEQPDRTRSDAEDPVDAFFSGEQGR